MVSRTFLKYASSTILFYLGLFLLFYFYSLSKQVTDILSGDHFINFDAKLYLDIKENGYHQEWLCAFFPAFPFLWKFLSVGAVGISLVNAFIYIGSISYLGCLYKLELKYHFFILSIPSLVFMFVPYSEALFFIAGSLVVVGLHKKNRWLLITGLVLCSLIRPTAFVFVPAILIVYFVSNNNREKIVKDSLFLTCAICIGLFITIVVHYFYVGKWFVFFQAQELWKNYLHLPKLPLTSWGGDASLRYEGTALFISIVSAFYVVNAILKRTKGVVNSKRDLIFSAAYAAGTGLLILIYRDGNLYSLNRFIYATPFVVVILVSYFKQNEFDLKKCLYLFFILELFWLLFASYNHIHNFLMFTGVSVYFVIMLLLKHPNKVISTASLLLLIGLNCFGMIKLLTRFLNGVWVG
jgi:hypothetical protein